MWAAAEALCAGRGGVSAVSRATGISRTTIYQGIKELDGSYEARATSILDYQRLTKFRVRFYWLHRFGRDVDQPEYFRLDRCRVAELIECLCSFDGWLDGDATEGCQIFE